MSKCIMKTAFLTSALDRAWSPAATACVNDPYFNP